jgi:hypothetical protein
MTEYQAKKFVKSMYSDAKLRKEMYAFEGKIYPVYQVDQGDIDVYLSMWTDTPLMAWDAAWIEVQKRMLRKLES